MQKFLLSFFTGIAIGTFIYFVFDGITSTQRPLPRTVEQKYQRLINEIKHRMRDREGRVAAKDGEYRTLDELLKVGTE